MEQGDQNTQGMLADIHQLFVNSAKTFRDLVCEGNVFSEASFYEKLLSKSATLSPAERKNALEMAEYVIDRLNNCINQHKKQ